MVTLLQATRRFTIFSIVQGQFLPNMARHISGRIGVDKVDGRNDGIGVSSPQIDDAERGLAFIERWSTDIADESR